MFNLGFDSSAQTQQAQASLEELRRQAAHVALVLLQAAGDPGASERRRRCGASPTGDLHPLRATRPVSRERLVEGHMGLRIINLTTLGIETLGEPRVSFSGSKKLLSNP